MIMFSSKEIQPILFCCSQYSRSLWLIWALLHVHHAVATDLESLGVFNSQLHYFESLIGA